MNVRWMVGILVLTTPACAQLEQMVGSGIETSVKQTANPEQTEEEKQWTWVEEKKEAAEKRPTVTDEATYKTALKAARSYGAQARVYVDQNCKEGKTGSHCGDAEKIMKDMVAAQREIFEKALGISSIDFSLLDDEIIELERQKVETPSIDPWMEELGKRKATYWVDELKGRGGTLAKYVAAKGEPQCLTYSDDPKSNDTKLVNFVAKSPAKAWIKCAFTKPPSTFKRDDGDYWKIEIQWAGHWEGLGMTYDVATPSTTPNVTFNFPTDVVGERINAKASSTGFLYPGTWLRVKASYMNRFITGKEWKDGKLVDVWKHAAVGTSTFYLKWK